MPGPAWYNMLAPATPTAPPVLIEPPSHLTRGHEVWIAAAGGAGWGGCQVWISLDDQSYDMVGYIAPGAIVGALASPLPAHPDPDTTTSVTVDVALSQGTIHAGSDTHADRFATLCWVNEELFSHTAATLIGPYLYRLDKRKRRGAFNTPIKDHPAGAPCVRMNQAIFRHQYPAHLVGESVWVKLSPFNEHQQMLQTLDEVQAHSITLTGASGK